MRVFQPCVFAEVCLETTFTRTSRFCTSTKRHVNGLKGPQKAKHNGLVLLALCPETKHDVALPQSITTAAT